MAHPQCVSPSLAGALSFSVRAENRRYNVFFFSPCSPFVPLFSFFHRRLVSISKRGGDASKNRLREPPARSRPTPTAQRSATAAYNRYYSRNSYLRLKRDSRHTHKRIEKEYHRGEHTRRINTASAKRHHTTRTFTRGVTARSRAYKPNTSRRGVDFRAVGCGEWHFRFWGRRAAGSWDARTRPRAAAGSRPLVQGSCAAPPCIDTGRGASPAESQDADSPSPVPLRSAPHPDMKQAVSR
jgi:hypothetical protein